MGGAQWCFWNLVRLAGLIACPQPTSSVPAMLAGLPCPTTPLPPRSETELCPPPPNPTHPNARPTLPPRHIPSHPTTTSTPPPACSLQLFYLNIVQASQLLPNGAWQSLFESLHLRLPSAFRGKPPAAATPPAPEQGGGKKLQDGVEEEEGGKLSRSASGSSIDNWLSGDASATVVVGRLIRWGAHGVRLAMLLLLFVPTTAMIGLLLGAVLEDNSTGAPVQPLVLWGCWGWRAAKRMPGLAQAGPAGQPGLPGCRECCHHFGRRRCLEWLHLR